MIDVGSSVLTIIEESLKMCSGSLIGSSSSEEFRRGCQNSESALKIDPGPVDGGRSRSDAGVMASGLEGGSNGDGGKEMRSGGAVAGAW